MKRKQQDRNWHPIELSILKHIGLYGLTYADCLFAAGTRGVKTAEQATQRLNALRKRGDLVSHHANRVTYYTLCESARRKLAEMKLDLLGAATHPRVLLHRFAILQLCSRVRPVKRLLTKSDLSRIGLSNLANGNPTNYYLTAYANTRTLGFVCVDRCERGSWDRLVRKTNQVVSRHINNPIIATLIRKHQFEIAVVTALPEKAERVAKRLTSQQQPLPVPVRVVPIPNLLQFVQPLPDPR